MVTYRCYYGDVYCFPMYDHGDNGSHGWPASWVQGCIFEMSLHVMSRRHSSCSAALLLFRLLTIEELFLLHNWRCEAPWGKPGLALYMTCHPSLWFCRLEFLTAARASMANSGMRLCSGLCGLHVFSGRDFLISCLRISDDSCV
jgi:hypothetical protein